MKKIILTAAVAVALLGACAGTSNYDKFIDGLKSQPARIDSIKTINEYVSYVDSLSVLNADFVALGIDLNEEQKAELAAVNDTIQAHIDAKYAELTDVRGAAKTIAEDEAADMPVVE